MKKGYLQTLVHLGDDFHIRRQILSQLIDRLELIGHLENGNHSRQTVATSAFSSEQIFHITSAGVHNLERATQNTLAPTQKVCCATKNRVLFRNHAHFLAHIAYEMP